MLGTVSSIYNTAILETLRSKLQKETWYNLIWAPYMASITQEDLNNGMMTPELAQSPIWMVEGFVEKGRDNMLIPFETRINPTWVYGDTLLKGNEAQMDNKYARVYVNQMRAAVTASEGKMSDQRHKIYNMLERAIPQLSRAASERISQEINVALLEGASTNITAGVADDGIGLVKRYHPHMYYNVAGALTAVGTEGKNKTATELDAMETAVDDKLDAAILRKFKTKLLTQRIRNMGMLGGTPLHSLIIHPSSNESLYSDSVFTGLQNNAFSGLKEQNPALANTESYYYGFCVKQDLLTPRNWDATNKDFFGTDYEDILNPITLASGVDNIGSVVLGPGAIAIGIAEDLDFKFEMEDYENIKGIGCHLIWGANRIDNVSETNASESSGVFTKGAAAAVASSVDIEHYGSAILFTDDHDGD